MTYNQRSSSSSSRGKSSRSRSDQEHFSRSSRSRPDQEHFRGASPQSRYRPEDDYEDYGSQTRQIQNDSLESSSRALGRLMHASEIAQSNLAKLATQTEQLDKMDKRLDEADHHVQVSETKTTRLKALNRWFFMPAVGAKSAKRKQHALEAKAQEKQDQQIRDNERERDISPRSSQSGRSGSAPIVSSRGSSSVGRAGHIHSTPEGLARDDVEEGIDSNLNQISAGLGRLKMMGASMNNELARQTSQLSRIQDRTDVNKDKISRLNKQMNELSEGKNKKIFCVKRFMTEAAKSKNALKNEAKNKKYLAKMAKLAEEKANPKPKVKKQESVVSQEPEEEWIDRTVPGYKKDLTDPMAAGYKPRQVESSWYSWWEKEGYFEPYLPNGKPSPKGTFVIPIPPPNVTGTLHLGHALTNSIQDCLIRWNRMHGKTVLYNPGCDHAGIATQVVVEKKLMREKGITRHDIGRSAFIDEVMGWKDIYVERIYNQLRKLGSSTDWTRAKFTMDPSLSIAVTEAFVRLHEEKVIYRANRLVNWCTKLKTALSNLEVENMELEGRTLMSVPDHDPKKKYEFGVLISFAYQIENSVATTRLETMLGDTAIAVHPSDKRYLHLHGKFAIHPFVDRRVPIIADEYPDPEFGTGAVKITPAHDFNDYIVGQRNKLPFINIFTDDGKINENGGSFEGLKRFDARVAILEALTSKGLYVKTEDNKMVIPICGRSGNIVEPLMKPQWWVDCSNLAIPAIKAVRSGELKIVPQTSENEWFRWLENIQDWCISRQLWWGHRIPAYFVEVTGMSNSRDDENCWVSGRSENEALEKAVKRFPGVDRNSITLHQDEDVLDTWFSSGLWPFSIMGWPEKTPDFDHFYPNSLLETGWDILFFWVARMVMMGLKLTGKLPFSNVFCHAMVRDAHGRKMSKSLGNVIDPLDVINGITLDELQARLLSGNLDPREVKKAQQGQKQDFPNGIPECGSDALRFTLLAYTSAGRDINLDILRVEGYRKFCNKLWNATRFALLKLGDEYRPSKDFELSGNESIMDLWILHKLNHTAKEINLNLEQMNFMQATTVIHQFWLHDLCDVYVEICKPILDGDDPRSKAAAKDVLYVCLEYGLKLMHPFMPFVTEELYQRLPRRPQSTSRGESIMISEFPTENSEWDNVGAMAQFETVNKVIHGSRSLISDYGIKKGATVYIESSNSDVIGVVGSHLSIIASMIKGCDKVVVIEGGSSIPDGCAPYNISEETNVHLLVRGMIDFDLEVEKIDKKINSIQSNQNALLKRQESAGYEKSPLKVREADEAKMKGMEAEIATLLAAKTNFLRLKN